MRRAGLLLALALALACHPLPPPGDPTVNVTCLEVCRRVDELHCAWAGSCLSACGENNQALNKCVAAATSCAAADRCDE